MAFRRVDDVDSFAFRLAVRMAIMDGAHSVVVAHAKYRPQEEYMQQRRLPSGLSR